MSLRPALATFFLAVVTVVVLSMTGHGLSAHPIGRYTSLVDCLSAQGKSSTFKARRLLAESEIHEERAGMMIPYRGTAEQNRHLANDHCADLYTSKHPKVTPEEEAEIVSGLIEIARAYGLDERKFVETARCESELYPRALGDYGKSRGLWQINKIYHPEVSDAVAYDWRKASIWAAEKFRSEKAGWWTCYRLAYRDSSPLTNQVTSNSDMEAGLIRNVSVRSDTVIDLGSVVEIP